MWRVTLFAVSGFIGLAIVTNLFLAVTNVAIKFEPEIMYVGEKGIIYRYLTKITA
jgi:hypothetical protein